MLVFLVRRWLTHLLNPTKASKVIRQRSCNNTQNKIQIWCGWFQYSLLQNFKYIPTPVSENCVYLYAFMCLCVYWCFLYSLLHVCYVFWVLCLMYIRFMLYNLKFHFFLKKSSLQPSVTNFHMLLWIYLYKVCCTAKLPWCALARRDVMSYSVYHCIRVKVNKCWCKFNKILDLSISEKICDGCQKFNKSYYGVSNTKFEWREPV